MPRIDALPEAIREVPDVTDRYDDHARKRWLIWRDAAIAYRTLVRRQMDGDPEVRKTVMRLADADPAYALLIFGVIHEPRMRGGRGGVQPFIPFGWQVDLIRWFEGRMSLDMGDGYVSKARGIGATWIFCWLALHGWLFRGPWDVLLVSRNAEQVDKTGDKKSMFNKIDFFMENLPDFLVPKGFDREKHRFLRLMLHPSNGNVISGDATTIKAGRGDRSTFILYDEAAAIPSFDEVWGTGSGTTDHRFAISTESMDEGGMFHAMWTSAKAADPNTVFELDWWRNPYMDNEWARMSRARAEADGQGHIWDREYGRDMMAGIGTYIYEYARSMNAQAVFHHPGMGRRLYCCVDPGLYDATALVWVEYDPGLDVYDILDAYMRSGVDSGYHASVMTGIPISGVYDYDGDALDIMRWTRTIRDPIIYVGDPYGHNKGGDGSQTFYEGIASKSKDLTGFPIHVMSSWEPEDRGLWGRHEALRELLPKMRFNDTPRVRRLLASLQEYRYKAPKDGQESTSTARYPIRIAGDHMITALEYLAVHRRISMTSARNPRAKPVRQVPKPVRTTATWAGGR
jgi:hypothetical protein